MTGVFTIPPDVSFVEALAEGLWQESEKDPLRLADMLVLLPTRRACRTLREAFLRVTDGQASLLPRMQPLGDFDDAEFYFAEDVLDPVILPAIPALRRQMLLARMILQKDKLLTIDQATEMAKALADLIDQTQTARCDFAKLESLVEGDIAKHWQDTVKFLQIITAEWPNILKEEKCLDPAERRNLILKTQAESWRKFPPSFPVIAAGSTASIPVVADLIAVIANMPLGRVVLPGLDQQLDEEAWQAISETHPQFSMKEWLELVGLKRTDVQTWPYKSSERSMRVRLLQESMRPADTTDAWQNLKKLGIPVEAVNGFCRLDLENQQEEAEVIALCMRAALEEEKKTATLITPDRSLATRVSEVLRRWNIEADDSGGTPLISLPLGSFLRDVLQAASPEASAIDYLALLKHPLTACGLEPATCRYYARQIEMQIWRGVSTASGWQASVHALREKKAGKKLVEFAETLATLFEPMTLRWPMPLPIAERIRQHIELVERIATTPNVEGAARIWRGKAGEDAAAFLNEWEKTTRDMPDISGEDYLRLFTALLRSVIVRPLYGKHPRLNILGPLEARLHHADLVILGGMNEGTWPPAADIDPWMSRPMKRNFGLPLPERRIGLSAHDFVQQASASEVIVTRARRVEGSPTVPSRFLMQIDAVLEALGCENALKPDKPWQEWAKQLDLPDKIIPCLPPEPCPPVTVRPRKLSVTEIGIWMRNPYAIYARYILGLKKLEDIGADVTAAERGIIIHEVLEKFLSRHKDKWPADALGSLLEEGRQAFAQYQDFPQVVAFWWPRFERIAAWFVDREEKRRAAGIRVLAVECKGKVELVDGKFILTGRADRIDKLPDGSAVIIDYKTGTLPRKYEIENGYEPQLPLLALIGESGGFEGLGKLNTSQLSYWRFTGTGEEEEVQDISSDLSLYVTQAQENLEKLVANFSKQDMPYRAVPNPYMAPRYDDYAHLARLVEWSRVEKKT